MPENFFLVVGENPAWEIDDEEESLFTQLKALDWDEVRADAEVEGEMLDEVIAMHEFMKTTLRATKQVQRE